jgi:ubiquinone/menaquinone biosynthesis C-methylase UbiE
LQQITRAQKIGAPAREPKGPYTTDRVKLPEHYQDGGPSVDFYDVRETGGSGTLLDGDVEFYVAQARETGGPVLDLACGTGRVAVPLARAGFDVTGIDRAPAMLNVARAKLRAAGLANLRFVRGNMARFTVAKRFRLVVIAYRAFQHLLTIEDQRSCLVHVRKHLRRKGRLVVHLFDPRLEFCVPANAEAISKRASAHNATTGEDVAVEVTDRKNDPVTQTFSEIWRWTVTKNGSVVRSYADVLRLRWTYRYELRYLFELAGFAVVAEHSDFKGSPPRYGAEQVWIVEAV